MKHYDKNSKDGGSGGGRGGKRPTSSSSSSASSPSPLSSTTSTTSSSSSSRAIWKYGPYCIVVFVVPICSIFISTVYFPSITSTTGSDIDYDSYYYSSFLPSSWTSSSSSGTTSSSGGSGSSGNRKCGNGKFTKKQWELIDEIAEIVQKQRDEEAEEKRMYEEGIANGDILDIYEHMKYGAKQCTKQQLHNITQQLPPHYCVKYTKQPWTKKCSFSYATQCPKSTWIEHYYLQMALESPYYWEFTSNVSALNFIGISVGCNKGYDAINTLRIGTMNPLIDKITWDIARSWSIESQQGEEWNFTDTDDNDIGLGSEFRCGQNIYDSQFNIPKFNYKNEEGNFDYAVSPRKGKMYCIEALPSNYKTLYDATYKVTHYDDEEEYGGFHVTHAAMSNDPTISSIYFPKGDLSKQPHGIETMSLSTCEIYKSKNQTKKLHRECVQVPTYTLNTYVNKYIFPFPFPPPKSNENTTTTNTTTTTTSTAENNDNTTTNDDDIDDIDVDYNDYYNPQPTINHVSIDVEGHDFDVLLGAANTNISQVRKSRLQRRKMKDKEKELLQQQKTTTNNTNTTTNNSANASTSSFTSMIVSPTSILNRVEYIEFEYNWIGNWGSSKYTLSDAIHLLDEYGFTCYWIGNDELWRITNCMPPMPQSSQSEDGSSNNNNNNNDDHDTYYDLKYWSNVGCVNRTQYGLYIIMETMFRDTISKPRTELNYWNEYYKEVVLAPSASASAAGTPKKKRNRNKQKQQN